MIGPLRAALIAVAYGLLFAGQIVLLPVAQAEGSTLDRISHHATAWRVGHQLLAAGAALLIPAGLALYASVNHSSRRLATVGLALQVIGASALIGQYALDFAFLELAQGESREAATRVASALLTNSSVVVLYFKLADAFILGSMCFAVAALRDRALRWHGGLAASLGIGLMISSGVTGPIGLRIGVGLTGLGFTLVAIRRTAPLSPTQALQQSGAAGSGSGIHSAECGPGG